ncbi:ABC transporter ATP-binding protein [Candidatus Oleimmundimicrobium sp.]|uniref:ABC transporter ATP-binding protein n=1 Tax=Candidatus Oleimmundimicrobium sp. TaxID=3060597 RepID=UPI002720A39A|nr:ABC transporter ATP-binding protein [Candidatus Oleimmundimicrobium sp.]MDO8886887.1 ABC transporter ATP-binding protein [Candidatus Oleimmundimicrobium sp.]
MIEIENLDIDLGEFKLRDINLSIKEDEVFVILGPSGAGKTVLLEAIAGFFPPKKGSIILDGNFANDLPPEKRNIGFIYQDYVLFPHLTVRENILFGVRYRQIDDVENKFKKIVATLNIENILHRRPQTLSGGEQQRVSLARALIMEPRLLLFDEPLSSLDKKVRENLREELRIILKRMNQTSLFVTHDQTEALVIADRIAIMRDGKIVQVGKPDEIFNSPVNEFVADFVGVETVLEGKVVSRLNELAVVDVNGAKVEVISNVSIGEKVLLGIRPENVTVSISKEKKSSSARNNFNAKIVKLTSLGAVIKVNLNCGFPLIALITKQSAEEIGLKEGGEVTASFKSTAVHVIRK